MKRWISGEELKKRWRIQNPDLLWYMLNTDLETYTEDLELLTKDDILDMTTGHFQYLSSNFPEAGYDGFWFKIENMMAVEESLSDVQGKETRATDDLKIIKFENPEENDEVVREKSSSQNCITLLVYNFCLNRNITPCYGFKFFHPIVHYFHHWATASFAIRQRSLLFVSFRKQ